MPRPTARESTPRTKRVGRRTTYVFVLLALSSTCAPPPTAAPSTTAGALYAFALFDTPKTWVKTQCRTSDEVETCKVFVAGEGTVFAQVECRRGECQVVEYRPSCRQGDE